MEYVADERFQFWGISIDGLKTSQVKNQKSGLIDKINLQKNLLEKINLKKQYQKILAIHGKQNR